MHINRTAIPNVISTVNIHTITGHMWNVSGCKCVVYGLVCLLLDHRWNAKLLDRKRCGYSRPVDSGRVFKCVEFGSNWRRRASWICVMKTGSILDQFEVCTRHHILKYMLEELVVTVV